MILAAMVNSVLWLAALNAQAQPNVARDARCTAAEYRQFDWWLGDWDVFDYGHPAKVVAHALIRSALGGCVVTEDYKDVQGSQGLSLSAYDAHRKLWQQSWVSNRPQVLILTGHAHEGSMMLTGSESTAQGEQLVRGEWTAVGGGVRERAQISRDGGKSWEPWFDLIFKPRRSP